MKKYGKDDYFFFGVVFLWFVTVFGTVFAYDHFFGSNKVSDERVSEQRKLDDEYKKVIKLRAIDKASYESALASEREQKYNSLSETDESEIVDEEVNFTTYFEFKNGSNEPLDNDDIKLMYDHLKQTRTEQGIDDELNYFIMAVPKVTYDIVKIKGDFDDLAEYIVYSKSIGGDFKMDFVSKGISSERSYSPKRNILTSEGFDNIELLESHYFNYEKDFAINKLNPVSEKDQEALVQLFGEGEYFYAVRNVVYEYGAYGVSDEYRDEAVKTVNEFDTFIKSKNKDLFSE